MSRFQNQPPKGCPPSIKQLRAAKLIRRHSVPKYRVVGFPNNYAEWGARDTLLIKALQRIQNVRRRSRKPLASDIAAAKHIEPRFHAAFYALREIDRMWHNLTLRMEAYKIVSHKMADAMLACPPAGYMVEPQRKDLNFRACRHRMCPWCHYRLVLRTIKTCYSHLTSLQAAKRYQDLRFTRMVCRTTYPFDMVSFASEFPTKTKMSEMPRRIRRKFKFVDGVTFVQRFPDTWVTTCFPRQNGTTINIGVIGMAPAQERFRGSDEEQHQRVVLQQMAFSKTALRKSILHAFYYPPTYLLLATERGLDIVTGTIAATKRIRPFGAWRQWLTAR